MYPEKTKRPKSQKIALVALALLFVLALPCSAMYITIPDGTLYVPLLDFQCQVEHTTFSLTPSVYTDSNTAVVESANKGNTTSTIKRTNWEIYDPSDAQYYRAWRDVSYRLGLNLYRDVEDFDMKITSQVGAYNFTSYDLPKISVPHGYIAEYDIKYRLYYADGNTHNTSYIDQTIQGVSDTLGEISLLKPYITQNGVNHDIVGNVLIVDYEAIISYTKLSSGVGARGYYTYNGVLGTLPETVYESLATDGDYWLYTTDDYDIQIVGTLEDGSTEVFNVDSIVFENDIDVFMKYELPDADETLLVYDMDSDEWYSAQIVSPDSGLEATFSPIQLRQMYFDAPLEQTFELATPSDVDLLTWFVDNTTYSPESFVLSDSQSETYDFTAADGGIYVAYTCVDSDSPYYVGYLKGFYDSAYKNGVNNGGGSGAGFIGKTSSWLLTTVSDALSIEIFPGFSIGGVLGVLVAILLAIVFLKVFAGG